MVTVSHRPIAPAAKPPPVRLVLAGLGPLEPLQLLLAVAAPRLAALTGLPLTPLPAPLQRQPERALAALHQPAADGRPPEPAPGSDWLTPLPLDPGLSLERGGSWAEALGAWRQPTLLLIDAAQMVTGWPAAATALLRQWRVPLLGLIQWGGAWDGTARVRDGLPWLGALDDGSSAADPLRQALDQEAAELLALRLRQRWHRLVQE